MGIFSRRKTNEPNMEFQERVASLQLEAEQLRNVNQRLKNANAEINARERLVEKLVTSFGATGSMTSDLYNQQFPAASKYQGAMSLYRSHWSGSNDHLRRLSRIAAFESPTGAAILGRLVDIVVGSGLQLQAEPMWDVIESEYGAMIDGIPRDGDERRAWRRLVERRYRLWWQGRSVSYTVDRNGPALDRQIFRYLLEDGEYFAILRYTSSRRGSPLTIQIVPPENVAGGTGAAAGNTIENGIEYDGKGIAVAYHILDERKGTTTRVRRFGTRSDRTFVIHEYLRTSEKQRRGVPYLANVIHELTKLGDYEVLEIQAAIINALFAVWVKPPEDMDGEPVIGAGAQKKSGGGAEITETGDPTTDYLARSERLDFSHGGVMLDSLPAGHSVESFDTKRPNSGFDKFFQSVKRNIAAAKSVPLAVVDLQFNTSYSGARGELLLFWMTATQMREAHAASFHSVIYQMWMWAEYDRGRISAPGFDTDPMIRAAFTNAQWIGNQRPDIDPLKTVKAHILEQNRGYKTGHQITAERGGGDYEENLDAITKEMDTLSRMPQVGGVNDTNDSTPTDPDGPGSGGAV